jgi:hypothetical protein
VDLCLNGEAWRDKIFSPYNAKGKRTPLNRYSRDDRAAAALIRYFIDDCAGHTTCTMSVCGDRANHKTGVRWEARIENELDGVDYYGTGAASTFALAVARAVVHLHEDKE